MTGEEILSLMERRRCPTDTGISQRGAEQGTAQDKEPTKRPGEKRLTLALDGETYRRLRLHAAQTDQTHQAILEVALAEYLKLESMKSEAATVVVKKIQSQNEAILAGVADVAQAIGDTLRDQIVINATKQLTGYSGGETLKKIVDD